MTNLWHKFEFFMTLCRVENVLAGRCPCHIFVTQDFYS